MNFRKFMLAALAVTAFAGCEKNFEGVDSEGNESVELSVRISGTQTKSEGTQNENNVKTVQIFVFDHNKMLEAYTAGDGSQGVYSISCSTGQKEVVALVNAKPLTDVKSMTDLEGRKTLLTDNAADSFVMEGRTKPQLRNNSAVDIDVYRVAARIAVTEVTVDFELDQHDNQTFQIKEMYLINVAGERTFLSYCEVSKWHNMLRKEKDAPSILGVTLSDVYASIDKPYNETHYLYCYPNRTEEDVTGGAWSARKTRLVVEAELGGKLYYYPVTIKDGILSNTSYEIKLKITRPGSSSPDKPVDSMTAGMTIDVQPWDDATLVQEVI